MIYFEVFINKFFQRCNKIQLNISKVSFSKQKQMRLGA